MVLAIETQPIPGVIDATPEKHTPEQALSDLQEATMNLLNNKKLQKALVGRSYRRIVGDDASGRLIARAVREYNNNLFK
jgi:hypothetical protein